MRSVAAFLGRFFYLVAFVFASHGKQTSTSESPQEVMDEFLAVNKSVARVRAWLIATGIMRDPLKVPHPNKLVVACMDGRIQMHALLGNLKLDMDCLRMPGSVTTEMAMIESIALAINEHKVKLVAILRHTDCAMEKISNDPSNPGQHRYGCLVNSLHHSDDFLELLRSHSSEAYQRFAEGKVKIGHAVLDTSSFLVGEWEEYLPLSDQEHGLLEVNA